MQEQAYVTFVLNYKLLLFLQFCSVPQLTNPSLSCRNFETFLYWNYSDTSLKPTFTVEVAQYTSNVTNSVENIPHRYCNVSFFVDDIEEHYYLTIKAFAGEEHITLSLQRFSLKDICMLDFPHVNLTTKGRTVKTLFEHPFFLYKKKNPSLKRKFSIDYEYTVEYRKKDEPDQTSSKHFTCKKRECESDFLLPKDEDYCLSFSGSMSGIQVISTDESCTGNHPKQKPLDKYMIIILTVIVCVIAIGSSLTGLVCSIMWKKNIPLPSSLASMLTGMKPYMSVKKEDSTFSVAKHVETPNQVVEEENRVMEQIKNLAPEHETPRFKIGLNNIDRDDIIIQPEVCDLVLNVSLSDQTDVKENTELLTNEPDNKSENSFSTWPSCISGYDKPHVLVEMSTDDTVQGYRPTQLD
ncbi:interferon gamma receptor 1-like isoform X2 [Polyodon spathula]|uniref:interferon gamma receptor 1-like isoform X2 n=1 Tax=Polyodon spathula TaxID=7913 RepID=UPI001B7F095A|nr:interferon gamma receptor 1-like isoform X2 [Polyodon spathula]